MMTARQLIAVVAEKYNLTREQVRSSRVSEAAKARWIVWYILRQEAKYSYAQIAREFDCDHSTVMGGVDGVRHKPWFLEIAQIQKLAEGVPPEPTHCAHCGQVLDAESRAATKARRIVEGAIDALRSSIGTTS